MNKQPGQTASSWPLGGLLAAVTNLGNPWDSRSTATTPGRMPATVPQSAPTAVVHAKNRPVCSKPSDLREALG
jgi:hypothetical protein